MNAEKVKAALDTRKTDFETSIMVEEEKNRTKLGIIKGSFTRYQ